MTTRVLSTAEVSFSRSCLGRSFLWCNSGISSPEAIMEEYKVVEWLRFDPDGKVASKQVLYPVYVSVGIAIFL